MPVRFLDRPTRRWKWTQPPSAYGSSEPVAASKVAIGWMIFWVTLPEPPQHDLIETARGRACDVDDAGIRSVQARQNKTPQKSAMKKPGNPSIGAIAGAILGVLLWLRWESCSRVGLWNLPFWVAGTSVVGWALNVGRNWEFDRFQQRLWKSLRPGPRNGAHH